MSFKCTHVERLRDIEADPTTSERCTPSWGHRYWQSLAIDSPLSVSSPITARSLIRPPLCRIAEGGSAIRRQDVHHLSPKITGQSLGQQRPVTRRRHPF
jgi:hypothetical protein